MLPRSCFVLALVSAAVAAGQSPDVPYVPTTQEAVEAMLKLADVKDTRESALSAMPEGLLSSLTAQEAADLLDYLCSADAGTGSKP